MRAAILLILLGGAGCGGRVEQEPGRNTVDSGGTPAETSAPTCAPGPESGGTTGTLCSPLTELRAEAEHTCKDAGGVAKFTPQEPCSDRFRNAQFTCCGPDGACEALREGGDSSCKTEADWQRIALSRCDELGKKTVGFGLSEPCGDGYKGYSYTCCAR